MDRRAGWTRKRWDRERFLSGERGKIPGPRTFRLLRIVTEFRDQRRAFADNRRARLRAKRASRETVCSWPKADRRYQRALMSQWWAWHRRWEIRELQRQREGGHEAGA